MEQHLVYTDPNEIPQNVFDSFPKTVYKYRSWKNDLHRMLLLERLAWFSDPDTLNDPYDLRPPQKINTLGVVSSEGYNKLVEMVRKGNPGMNELEIEKKVKFIWGQIQHNPQEYFESRRKVMMTQGFHKIFGLFSTSINGVSESLWANYGDNHRGFAIGFDTQRFFKAMNCACGHVIYSDKVTEYNVLDDNSVYDTSSMYKKSKRWGYEEEFRFVTVIPEMRNRGEVFPIDSISEILLGCDIDVFDQKEIMDEIKKNYGDLIPVYKMKIKNSAYGFDREQIA